MVPFMNVKGERRGVGVSVRSTSSRKITASQREGGICNLVERKENPACGLCKGGGLKEVETVVVPALQGAEQMVKSVTSLDGVQRLRMTKNRTSLMICSCCLFAFLDNTEQRHDRSDPISAAGPILEQIIHQTLQQRSRVHIPFCSFVLDCDRTARYLDSRYQLI